ncbi:uroporphyrinogen decarboxylase family protein [Clostridium cylindrosporum DSM 605]|uniref:Uroporphyrinogen decarboxylase family protein n=1 Tax=Clostridium cylindrosporum DSM 605 TaxID=1121307 RepID=A0A0J8D7X1_CLOCY|nr:uroporphyrinogen decarboxylase family protein [Clostridium cylindrosporum]KMT21977.1 uroporphyrinogen decarboxylase family protein [Clostridium cylindrosporum DSM 605]
MNNISQNMTPKERISEYFKGNEVDRLPYVLMLGETAAKYAGVKVKDYYFNVDLMVEVEKYAIRELGAESAISKLTLRGIAEAIGSKIKYTEDSISYVEEFILDDYSKLGSLKLIDPYKDGRIPIVLEGLKRLQKEVGDFVPVGTDIAAPVSLAALVRGADKLLRDFRKNKEELHTLLEYLTECNLIFVKTVYDNFGIACGIDDPFISGNLISYKVFEEFGKPYLEKTIDGIYKITGQKPGLHICGKTKHLWNDIGNMNIGNFSVDNCEDIGELKQAIGNKVCIVGNVEPVDTLRYGSVDDIYREVKTCIEKASDSPKGYIAGPGCQMPIDTPIENIRAFGDAVKKYSKGAKIGTKCI